MGLDDDPFDHRATQDGRVLVSRGGRLVVTVSGARAARLVAQLGRDPEADQHLLARATGNYRRGNEKRRHRP
ncbi:YjbF family lipoprotein [Isoptericola sp. 4D.3]|uniref:YjbF family lipoprotein n=1 Tax=Isoptericola peretonis TaxID=2918523 RepID=A0ABT0IYC4_9MICO|nr:YjbF family lipoprotein [Isoptericola sp. 4D.3]